jgi:ABC-type Zn uptake system ZnuABC Zn-binding protein ZnuA
MRQSIKKQAVLGLPWMQDRRTIPLLCLVVATGLLTLACGATSSPTPASRLPVVATIPILADLARNVGGDLVEVRTILPPGVDTHSFQATPDDSTTISRARVIISNGAGLDDFIGPVLRSAQRSDAVHLVVSVGLEGAPTAEGPGGGPAYKGPPIKRQPPQVEAGDVQGSQSQGEASAAGAELPAEYSNSGETDSYGDTYLEGDPHFWQDPHYTIRYVEQIRDGLAQADPGHLAVYQANAAAYIQQLQELDREIARALSEVPPERRYLVTFHDAFGHFARRYGWQVSAFVALDAGDVTPGKVATVLEAIKENGIPALFVEPQFPSEVVQQAARDAGVKVGTIYSDALDAQVPTYIDMMRFNARSLADHLR